MFNKIKEFFSKKPEATTDATWPFPNSRPGDTPIFTPEPINATPIPLPPVIEPVVKKAPAVKTTAKTTKAASKPPTSSKTSTTTKRSPGRPSKNQ